MRRRRRKFSGPKRPLRWIYSGDWENDNEETDCAVVQHQLACGLPVAVVDPPRDDVGEFWHEILRGETDLDFSDKAAPCVTRIVGDVSMRAGWNWLYNPAPAVGHVDLPPYVRLGLCVVDEPEGTGWIPPDLWDADDGDGVRWLWRAQHSFSGAHASLGQRIFHVAYSSGSYGLAGPPTEGRDRVNPPDWNFHLDVRVNATVNKNQSLILCHSYRFEFPGFLVGIIPVDVMEEKADINIALLHDLRCLVKS